ncbi:hypothetical protein FNU76_16925 [Chitinimonas arctica]|uniref:HipA-like kinase domain-containing protein n=1 Tax=Chitinimonas arctica TaxID=2594795 RepID=A0A516SMI7_9NEIS|nr:HipA family kinase [Chitinimonas arctica]QDQ29366.1 hypothetical protein FNU76_16925 [Chitinimonas arctica]
MPVQIIEILGPSEQGLSRPYLCRGEDDAFYYVKGKNTDRHSLWSEWTCGHLGMALGLPLPAFCVVDIPAELIVETPAAWRELGVGLAFGSRQYPGTSWFEPSFACRVPDKLKCDLLLFDWWVRNGDRLTTNPNLLWDSATASLVVIDHNRAFDADFDPSLFLKHHVFADIAPTIFDNLVGRAESATRLANLLAVFDSACDNVPEEWHWANAERDVPANFDTNAARARLARCSTPDFWRMV